MQLSKKLMMEVITIKLTNRDIQALNTKNRLFESAIELFRTEGFENVHIEDITKKAGTSKGSFYTYFKSKDEVIVEHYDKIDEFYKETYSALDPNMKSTEKLKNMFFSGFHYTKDIGHEFLNIVLINQLSQSKETTRMNHPDRQIFKIIHEIIEEGQQRGEFHTDLTALYYADILVESFRGIFAEYCLRKEPELSIVDFGKDKLELIIDRVLLKK